MDKFLNLADLAHFWGRIKAKLDGKQNALVSGTNIKTINNENLLGSGNIDIHGDDVFVAVYEQTSYADVTAAIDASKVIMLDMPANHNLFNITHATYTNGGNAIMYAIFKMNNRSTLMTATLTPAGIWTVVHTDLQDKLVSGTNIKTINNQSLLGSGNINIEGGSIGYIDYDSVTFDEAAEILANNTTLFLKLNNVDLPIIFYDIDTSTNYIRIAAISSSVADIRARRNAMIYSVAVEFRKHITEGTLRSYYAVSIQERLISGNNIKTINNQSLLGSGNISIQGGGTVDTAMSDTSENAVQNKVIKSYVDTADTNLQNQLDTLTGRVGQNFEVGKEKWYGTYTDENGITYQVYSKMVYIPALPSTPGITTYSHGVSNIKQILSIYGFTTDGFVLNAPRQVASDNITIYQASKSSSNQTFSIEVGKDRSSKKAYVVMIYAKNN